MVCWLIRFICFFCLFFLDADCSYGQDHAACIYMDENSLGLQLPSEKAVLVGFGGIDIPYIYTSKTNQNDIPS